jgi:hypothetical protein
MYNVFNFIICSYMYVCIRWPLKDIELIMYFAFWIQDRVSVRIFVFNATFKHISVVSWWTFLLTVDKMVQQAPYQIELNHWGKPIGSYILKIYTLFTVSYLSWRWRWRWRCEFESRLNNNLVLVYNIEQQSISYI